MKNGKINSEIRAIIYYEKDKPFLDVYTSDYSIFMSFYEMLEDNGLPDYEFLKNKKVDYDTELPEKMREEVYKKGIGNILKLSNFLKYKNNISKDNLLNRSGSSKRKQNNRIKNEINDYLKYNEQVKKYDSGNNNISTQKTN